MLNSQNWCVCTWPFTGSHLIRFTWQHFRFHCLIDWSSKFLVIMKVATYLHTLHIWSDLLWAIPIYRSLPVWLVWLDHFTDWPIKKYLFGSWNCKKKSERMSPRTNWRHSFTRHWSRDRWVIEGKWCWKNYESKWTSCFRSYPDTVMLSSEKLILVTLASASLPSSIYRTIHYSTWYRLYTKLYHQF